MKTLLISTLSLALLAGCSKREDTGTVGSGRPIEVSAGLSPADRSKSSLSGPVTGDAFPSNTTNVFFVTSYEGVSSQPDLSSSYFEDVAVNSDASGALSLSPSQYYPANGDKLYFYAYSPAGTSVIVDPSASGETVHYTVDGRQDIMSSEDLRGLSSLDDSHPRFTFSHKLQQVVFKVVRDASFEEGIALTSLEIVGAKTSVDLSLSTGTLSWGTATGDLTAYRDAQGQEITATPTPVGTPLMFEPIDSFTVRLVAGGVSYEPVTVKLAGTIGAGAAHEVTFTFARAGLASSAELTTWREGDEVSSGDPSAYPYVSEGKYIVSRDAFGSSGAFLHPVWPTGTPAHYDSDAVSSQSVFNTLSGVVEVAEKDAGMWTYESVVCPEGWRKPTARELLAMARLQGELTGVSSLQSDGIYWSSTATDADYSSYWCVRMDRATDCVSTAAESTASLRCVRDVEPAVAGH